MTMYLEHFGLREAPFRITPHTEFFFSGANRGATLEALLYAITAGEGMVKVTGEVGSGKTMLCRVLMERLPETRRDHLPRGAAPLARRDARRDRRATWASTPAGRQHHDAGARAAGQADRAARGRTPGGGAHRRGARDAARHARGDPPAVEPRDRHGQAAADRALRPARARRAPGAAAHAPAEGAHHAQLHAGAAAAARDRRVPALPPARRRLPRPGPLRRRTRCASSPTPPRASRGASTSSPTRRCSPRSPPARTRSPPTTRAPR